MPTLLLKSQVNLEEHNLPLTHRHYGALFHRWLPDGKKNAIVLILETPMLSLGFGSSAWASRMKVVSSNSAISIERLTLRPYESRQSLRLAPLWGC